MTISTDPILDAFSALAARRPQAPLVCRGDDVLTIGDLDSLARSYASTFERLGFESGQIIGLSASDPPGFLAAFLALRQVGCAALLFDATSPLAEMARIARQMGARSVVTLASGWERPAEPRFSQEAALPETEWHCVAADVAALKLTSGSTGRPQGVLTPSEALVADDAALARTMGLGADERILVAVPLSHSYGLSSIAMPALMRGSALIVAESEGPVAPLLTAANQGVTFIPTVPAYLSAVVRLAAPPPLPPSVRRVISAGAPLAPRTAALFRRTFGLQVHVFYGSSECGGICFDREGGAAEEGSVGTPIEGVEVALLPLTDATQAPYGRVVVGGPAVARGYFPEPQPSLEGGRFRTRDLGRWEDGRLFLTGRIDDLIDVRGKHVNPREVEAVLAGVEGVEEVAVLGIPARRGSGEVVRAVVAAPPGSLHPAALREWCRQHLADYKVPRSLVLVDALPRTARGKLDLAALRELVPAAGALPESG